MNISGTPLVLRRFQIDETGVSGANVWIEARQAGIISFLLTLVGLDPNSSLKVTRGSISFRNSSVFGSSQVSTPLANIGAFVGGYKKPFVALLLAIIFFIGGLFMLPVEEIGPTMFGIMSVLSVICLIYYYLRKTMFMGFETSGGGTYGFAFQASVLEGVGVDIKRVENTIAYVNSLISSASLGEHFIEQNQTQVLGGRTATMLSSMPTTPSVQHVPAQVAPAPVPTTVVQPAPVPQPAVQAPAAPQPAVQTPAAPQPAVQAPAAPQPQTGIPEWPNN